MWSNKLLPYSAVEAEDVVISHKVAEQNPKNSARRSRLPRRLFGNSFEVRLTEIIHFFF